MSQSDNMSVEHSAVSSHVSSLQNNFEQLNTQSDQFLSAIEPLKASWKGTSVDAWNNMTEAWNDNMEQVKSALEQLTGRVEQAGKDYQAGEEEQTSTLQQRFAGMDFQSGPIL
ncbi:WXG100 family type VII secretion target [Corynebacterium cystitidis]|uniref:WXG100 family type VII secretion target n=1 Tax=Corynebacterium cystitidis DSM 20524 TaxID=1121357 RepID=A0A1H9WEV4_9CORY|nr:WXG100 family type VII secretion target [Corynebacterium cystitidis]WJY83410.1 WXG domain conatining protein [Corynebacterium cystitidis DSM 20524]SES32440.1 WXG100 family type VII secretion target [Corynebacterium cystitidis DSM 20524]SNV61989.1 WXG100 family type VII secretion target [Corynebacterium cystitidis]